MFEAIDDDTLTLGKKWQGKFHRCKKGLYSFLYSNENSKAIASEKWGEKQHNGRCLSKRLKVF